MSFTPASSYDLLSGDYLTRTLVGALNDTTDPLFQTGGSFHYPSCTSTGAGSEPATLFPTYDEFCPSSTSTATASTSSGDWSISWDSTPTTFSGASFGDLFIPSDGQEGDDSQTRSTNNEQHEQVSTLRRTRGPNRRRPGTGYTELMDKLPQEVQDALKRTYGNCCELMTKRDNSTVQKHQFSNRHCSNIPHELQVMLPSFTCPAFVAMHESCRSAKHGRYDSTERHCKNCPGYKEINTADNLYPIELTKAEFKAVQDHRKRAHPEQQVYPLLLQNAVSKVIKMVLEDQPLGTMYTSTGFSADAGQHPSMSRGGGSGYGHYLPGFQYDY